MNLFMLLTIFSFLTIFLGGVLSLILPKNKLFKIVSTSTISLGSLTGIITSTKVLLNNKFLVDYNIKVLNYFNSLIELNKLSAFFILIISLITLFGTIYGYSYLNNNSKKLRNSVNTFFYSILSSSMILVVLSNNLLLFAFAWELMSISSYFLVIYDYEKREVQTASTIYFVFAHIGGLAIIASFGLIYLFTGSFEFESLKGLTETTKIIIFLLAFIGFGSKAGLFPLHFWLPYAHPVAPSHVSALMSGVMIKIGIYGLIKLYFLLAPSSYFILIFMIIIGAISGIYGVAYALAQHNLKQLLAYHSIENIGIITLGFGVGMFGNISGNSTMEILGFVGAFLHILNHAIFKSLLFLGAGAVLHN